ncbi:GspE/PulE family protein [Jutongia huaianensis]|jgi:type IV pilus assembly protein PilB|uniref:Flp pilus assembly complex ATPase component TadA n=1 Tax=Jutongia huaianensis TaxID=2763668 RepID=A0ABR7N0S1_9FIRM|nr:ATPase, T2SS/T4P/T4SS family [Jutongia huaianensis]MBC8562089.1 Flp pilus assembly complex ATPase component TadA [Jutongia huaianensis]
MDNSIASRLRRKKRLGDLLLGAGVITQEQLEEALKKQKEAGNGQKLGMTLVDMGIMNDEIIAEALCHQMGLERVHLAGITIEDEVLALVDEKVLRKYMLLPYEFAPDNPNVLRVAFSDPLDMIAMDDLSIITGMQIEVRVTTVKDVSQALDRFYGNSEAMKVADQFAAERREKYGNNKDGKEESEEVKQAPIVRLVNQIIEQAVHKRTSDIHFEPLENQLRIRFRVDGVLQEAMRHDISLLSAMVARIKIVGGMDISEKRKPQDGRMTQIVDRQEYDIRVSILPTVYGEKIVMRLAQKTALSRDKKDLGFEPEELHRFEDILKHPNGIMLVTGPTGSGKSTTLYTALSELNTDEVNIITVEDPVEANINGINQVQVNAKAGLTFAAALRSILRQDPDIIMIGEIRDGETAGIAVESAITGHLVVSTLHTNSAASTISRLADMGIENYLISDAVIGVIAQRLLRRVCPRCKRMVPADDLEKKELGIPEEKWGEEILIPHIEPNEECLECGGAGYKGRIGIYEIMQMSPSLKRIIATGGTAEELEKQAIAEGMNTLVMSANKQVLKGITTLQEVHRVAYDN